ncbi:MAG: [FeFe] hydrogenase H-cluster radical SAM maturase HydE [Planctomycetes bacterium RBG_19FT_COMBO_48_8]|nr:MAG: [FeFe] hydrogenase H-cluster radical SAM maturase HydE [Planctomycetes bacterium RBG_19FT_COMBO_48_8]
MIDVKLQSVLRRVYDCDVPARSDLEYLLVLEEPSKVAQLFAFADAVRKEHVGDGILLRGIIEFSNYCRNTCLYCGLNRDNSHLGRYRLSKPQILQRVEELVRCGIKTVVLQSGEDDTLDPSWFEQLIKEITSQFDIAVTLSVGQKSRRQYELWKLAGADRYLLKIETTDPELYAYLHPGMSFDNHLRCTYDLQAIGYQTGSGNIVGLKGQTIATLAEDILFFRERDFDMLSVGPFIPNRNTALGSRPLGDLDLTLRCIAVTRIVTRNTHIPANTAVASLAGRNGTIAALRAGANVVMPNFTPGPYKSLYEIYPGKKCLSPKTSISQIEKIAGELTRYIDYTRGDSLKRKKEQATAMAQS